jgi:hypothetical protein
LSPKVGITWTSFSEDGAGGEQEIEDHQDQQQLDPDQRDVAEQLLEQPRRLYDDTLRRALLAVDAGDPLHLL